MLRNSLKFAHGRRMRSVPLFVGIAAVVLSSAFTECPALESGVGNPGKWVVVWRYDEANGIRTEFEQLHKEGNSFPFRWRQLNDTRGNRLQFLDEVGAEDRRIELAPGERALASEDGSAWIILSPDVSLRDSHILHFFRQDSSEHLWEAYTGGDPVLLANDGSVLLLAAHEENQDRSSRRIPNGAGRLQLIGGEAGEIRGELPIYPTFARMSSDGQRVVLLQDNELVVLQTNGRIAWKTDVPLDNMIARERLSHLATASDLIVVCGTGEETSSSEFFDTLHPRRREELLVFNMSGKLLWDGGEIGNLELRFSSACAISPDGSTIATLRDTDRDQIVTAYEARTGEKLFEQRVRRSSGTRDLSVSPRGELICLAFGDSRTAISAWNRKGNLVFAGILPLRSTDVTAYAGDLLTSEQWVVRLIPEAPAR